jgi:hypothetical protein
MPPRALTALKYLLICSAMALTVASCGVGGGGGGGGSDSANDGNYPGYTDFQVERDSLDSGDLTDVTLTVYDINQDGIYVKFHYPPSLRFIPGSAITYSGDAQSWSATAPFDSATTSNGKYLVFRVSPPPEDQTNRVGIGFTMRATGGDPSSYIEVDLDNNDPTIPDGLEFNSKDPQFYSDDRWNISIAGTPIATPTPAATGSATPAPNGSATPAPSGSATPSTTDTPAT